MGTLQAPEERKTFGQFRTERMDQRLETLIRVTSETTLKAIGTVIGEVQEAINTATTTEEVDAAVEAFTRGADKIPEQYETEGVVIAAHIARIQFEAEEYTKEVMAS
jgi:hypothetical protein